MGESRKEQPNGREPNRAIVLAFHLPLYFPQIHTMKSLLPALTFLANLWIAMADKEAFVGKWKIVDALDEDFQPFVLPTGDFYMELMPATDDSLSVSIKIGNSLGTKIKFGEETAEGDSITVNYVVSSRMMPPEHLFRLETFLTNTLPKMTTAKTETMDGTTQMTLSGMGKLSFEKV